jgi:group I intron endonuclease
MQIYKITNEINGKIYIGKNATSLPNYMGSGVILNEAKLKYGIENFSKEILEDGIQDIETLNRREVYWISFFNSQDRTIGYNITTGGDGNTGKWNGDFLTDDHRTNIGKAMKGREITWKEKLSEARKNSESVKKLYESEEWRAKISNSLKGVKKTEEHIENLKLSIHNSEKYKNSRTSDEFKEKCSAWQKGKKREEEYMKKWMETKRLNSIKRAEEDKHKILSALIECEWNIEECAKMLNCHKQTVKSKIKKYNLSNE